MTLESFKTKLANKTEQVEHRLHQFKEMKVGELLDAPILKAKASLIKSMKYISSKANDISERLQ